MRRLFIFLLLSLASAVAQSGSSGGVRTQGTPAVNDCAKFVSKTVITSAGAACGSGGGGAVLLAPSGDQTITGAHALILDVGASFQGKIDLPIFASQLATPAAPTVTPTLGASTAWTYAIAAKGLHGFTPISATGSTAAGAASLDSSHFNTITWSGVANAQGYAVFLITGGGYTFLASTGAGVTTYVDHTGTGVIAGDIGHLQAPPYVTGQPEFTLGAWASNIYVGPNILGGNWTVYPNVEANVLDSNNFIGSSNSDNIYALYTLKQSIDGLGSTAIYGQSVTSATNSDQEGIGIEGDAYGSATSTGTLFNLAGVVGNAVILPGSTGNTDQYITSFEAFSNGNSGSGTLPANYGYHSQDQHGVSSTLNAQYSGDTQGNDAATYSLYFPGTGTGDKALFGSSVQVGSLKIGSASVLPVLSGTTGSIGGGALLAGACATGTATVTGATTGMTSTASPVSDPDSNLATGVAIYSFVSSSNTVTVRVCAIVAVTPAATTYNVRVLQ